MKNVYLRNSGLNHVVLLFAILLLTILGVSVFLLTPLLRTDRGGSTGRSPAAIHLVDEFKPENVEGTPEEAVTMPPRAEWRFDGSTPSPSGETGSGTLGWQAGPGVADLQVRDGRLVGCSTSDCPIIYAERTIGLDDPDLLYVVEIRMRVSAGANLSLTFDDSEELSLKSRVGKIKRGAVHATTPIVADNERKTYIIRGNQTEGIEEGKIRHVVIRPTDVNEATFEIESFRLVFHREYLANIPSGAIWQSLSKIYHQMLVADSPNVPVYRGFTGRLRKNTDRLAWYMATCADPNCRDPIQAVELAERTAEEAPEEASFWTTLGVAHYRTGGREDAIAALQKSMEFSSGGSSSNFFFLAMSHWQLGHEREARQWYDQAVGRTNLYKEELDRFLSEAAELLGPAVRKPWATVPQPANGADLDMTLGSELRWISGLDATAHNVYFGAGPENLTFLGKVEDARHAELPELERLKWYCWRVDTVKSDGSVVTGKMWGFSTGNMIG